MRWFSLSCKPHRFGYNFLLFGSVFRNGRPLPTGGSWWPCSLSGSHCPNCINVLGFAAALIRSADRRRIGRRSSLPQLALAWHGGQGQSMDTSDDALWFMGDLSDPWVVRSPESSPDARASSRCTVRAIFPSGRSSVTGRRALIVIHRHRFSAVDAQRLKTYRDSSAPGAARVRSFFGEPVRSV